MTLKFENVSNNENFIIPCLYEVIIPDQNIQTFKNYNILLEDWDQVPDSGFCYLLNEIDKDDYSNIEYS